MARLMADGQQLHRRQFFPHSCDDTLGLLEDRKMMVRCWSGVLLILLFSAVTDAFIAVERGTMKGLPVRLSPAGCWRHRSSLHYSFSFQQNLEEATAFNEAFVDTALRHSGENLAVSSFATSFGVTTLPLLFSLVAGLSTCLGAAVVFWTHSKQKELGHRQLLSFSLSLAASVMLTVSFASILPESFRDASSAAVCAERLLGLGTGCFLYFCLSKFVFPEPNEILGLDESRGLGTGLKTKTVRGSQSPDLSTTAAPGGHHESELSTVEAQRAWRVAVLLFVSLAVHNFPEGLAVAASTVHSQRLGAATAIAIALHNIPEGLAIAIPMQSARPDSPWLAFGLASLSGLAEPLGAAVALALLNRQGALSQAFDVNMLNVLAFVAGVMIMVALCELLPEAIRHSKEERLPLLLGTATGMIVMLASESLQP